MIFVKEFIKKALLLYVVVPLYFGACIGMIFATSYFIVRF